MKTPLLPWLFLISLLRIICDFNISLVAAQCMSDQKMLLLQLRSSLKFDSTFSTKLVNWNTNTDNCCYWPGVKCDDSGHVISLILDNEYITLDGSQNSSTLFSLQYLESLNLAFNTFNSTPFPVQIYNLTNLTYLNLSNTGFGGKIPNGISRLTRLVTLDLSVLYLIGTPLIRLENPNLKQFFENSIQLRQLYLDGVDLSAQRGEWCQALSSSLPNLRVLSLRNCGVSSPIHPSLSKLRFLSKIYLDLNDFSSTVPKFFANFLNLKTLSLRACNLQGAFPREIFQLQGLQELSLANNQNLSGSFPSFPKNGSLKMISVSGTQFSGSLPASISNLSNLSRIDLSFCKFSGSIPSTMAQLTSLIFVDFSFNNLSVDISSGSSTTSFLPQIHILKMSSCGLQKFPDLRNQSRLIHLDLSDNEIRGEIPNWIWNVGNGSLAHLNLSCNFLDDLEKPYTIPSSVSVLDLHSNQLQGQLPIGVVPSQDATYLDYSNNFFNGSIPLDLGSYVPFASFLSLSNNSFTGAIPESICNASSLEVLDLSNNKLNGILPSCLFSNFWILGVLNLGKNQITGNIPDLFPSNCALKTLNLGRNFLEGRIPSSLINCSSLEVLNLGSNKIVDTFPCPLKNLSSMRVLILRSNGFNGYLHCVNANHMWPNLQIIDIASNNFSGELSPKLLNWKGMTVDEDNIAQSGGTIRFDYLGLENFYYQDKVILIVKGVERELVKILIVFTSIDFSSNNFHGIIPNTIGALTSLYFLNLSHNALTGNIPKAIGNLKRIESLDLSANHLDGEVPTQLAELTFLSDLNLSFNRLSGMIPIGNQLNTFGPDSYLNNQQLCGFPLSKSCKSPTCSRGGESERELGDAPQPEIKWEYVTSALGFMVGLGAYLWMLLHNKRCKEAYQQLDNVLVWLFSPRQRGRKSLKPRSRVRRNRILSI